MIFVHVKLELQLDILILNMNLELGYDHGGRVYDKNKNWHYLISIFHPKTVTRHKPSVHGDVEGPLISINRRRLSHPRRNERGIDFQTDL